MAYLGKGLGSLTTANITVDKMTGNGSTATLTITLAQGVNSVNDISVFVSGVMQRPGTDYTLSGSTLTFTTAPAIGLQVVAVSHGDSALDNVADATAITASFDNNSVPDSAIGSLAASKLTGALAGAATNLTGLNAAQLTGALPAMSAANLTGITSYTKSASDPATNTNPSGGTGSVWVNYTSGETYVCTDATTDANVWTNVGTGTGDIAPWQYGGTIAGYTMGGYNSPATHGASIQKIDFASDSAEGEVGQLSLPRHENSTQSSATHGYVSGGGISGSAPWNTTVRDKYQFGTNSNSVPTPSLPAARSNCRGNSNDTHGFICGGSHGAIGTSNVIEKFSFAIESDTADHGDLSTARGQGATSGNKTHGYITWGQSNTSVNLIDKYSYTTNVTAVDIGDMTERRYLTAGHSSSTHGYTSGGGTLAYDGKTIDKFSFASGGAATDHGDISLGRNDACGNNSFTHGYTSGGQGPGTSQIDKWSMTSNTISSNIGALSIQIAFFEGTNY